MWTVLLQLRPTADKLGHTLSFFSGIAFEGGKPVRAADGTWQAAPPGWGGAPVATAVIPTDQLTRFLRWAELDSGPPRYDLGGELYDLLAATAPGALWATLRGACAAGELRTLFECAEPGLPLELLRGPDRPGARNDFVFVKGDASSRLVCRARPANGPTTPPWPLRVLVVLGPEPEGKGIAGGVERAALIRLFQQRRHDVDWRFLPCPSIEALHAALTVDPADPDAWAPHVLHFIGHGELSGKQGSLIVGKGAAQEEWTAQCIAEQVGVRLRCAILNACGTSSAAASHSVAEAFLDAGAAAVVAMSTDVLGTTAASFAEKLYAALLDGTPVDEAMRLTRGALYRDDPKVADWAIPQLLCSASCAEALAGDDWRLLGRKGQAGTRCEGVEFTELDRFVDQRDPRHRLSRTLDAAGTPAPAVLVHGAAETGKHTIIKWAIERAFRRSWNVRFLDAEGPEGRRPGPDHWSQGSTLQILRRIRDGASADPAMRAHFRDFAFVANHVLRGRRPPDAIADGPIEDEGHEYDPTAGALPDWLERVAAAFVGGLREAAHERPMLLVLHRVDHWTDLTRCEIVREVVSPLVRGAAPNVTVLVTDDDGATADAVASLEKLELHAPNVADPHEADDAFEILEDYVALGGFRPEDLPEARETARAYFDRVHRSGKLPFRLHRLPRILQAFRLLRGYE